MTFVNADIRDQVNELQKRVATLESDNAEYQKQLVEKDQKLAVLRDELDRQANNHSADNMAQAREMDFRDGLIACRNPEDILLKGTEILVWDGCDYHIDYVEVDVESGAYYMANGAEPVSYMVLKEPES